MIFYNLSHRGMLRNNLNNNSVSFTAANNSIFHKFHRLNIMENAIGSHHLYPGTLNGLSLQEFIQYLSD